MRMKFYTKQDDLVAGPPRHMAYVQLTACCD